MQRSAALRTWTCSSSASTGPNLRPAQAFAAANDLHHTVKAEEALMQAFIPGTGPFRFRFADHVRT